MVLQTHLQLLFYLVRAPEIENSKDSDFDLLILVDQDKISYSDEQRIKDPLYDLEFETGKIISPVIFSRKDWESRHRITPLYRNIKKEGILL